MLEPSVRDDRPAATDRVVRQFAASGAAIFGAAALAQFWLFHRSTRSAILAVVALLALAGIARPRLVRPVFVGAMAVAAPIGHVLSYMLLGVAYFAVFTPMALVFKFTGRDALARRRRSGQSTYWVPKSTPTDPRSYLRTS